MSENIFSETAQQKAKTEKKTESKNMPKEGARRSNEFCIIDEFRSRQMTFEMGMNFINRRHHRRHHSAPSASTVPSDERRKSSWNGYKRSGENNKKSFKLRFLSQRYQEVVTNHIAGRHSGPYHRQMSAGCSKEEKEDVTLDAADVATVEQITVERSSSNILNDNHFTATSSSSSFRRHHLQTNNIQQQSSLFDNMEDAADGATPADEGYQTEGGRESGGAVGGHDGREPDGISRTVETIIKISKQVEAKFLQDEDYSSYNLEQMAFSITQQLQQDASHLQDFPTFCDKMDEILATPDVRDYLSSESPFRKILFVWLINFFYLQQLSSARQFFSQILHNAIEYIDTFLSFSFIRRSSSMMSFCGGSNNGGDDQSSSFRSRISSIVSNSAVSDEGEEATSGGRYSNSTFDLDLSSVSSNNTEPCGAPVSDTTSNNVSTTVPIRIRESSSYSPQFSIQRQWQSQSLSTSVDSQDFHTESSITAHSQIIHNTHSTQAAQSSRSTGVVRRKTTTDATRKPKPGRRPRARESDVDSTTFYFEEDEVISTSAAATTSNSHSFVFPPPPPPSHQESSRQHRQQQYKDRQTTQSSSFSAQANEETKEAEQMADLREQHRQRAINRRRKNLNFRGKLPSFSDELAFTNDCFFEEHNADTNDWRRDRKSESDANSAPQDSSKTLAVTATLIILAAIMKYKQK